MGLEMYAEERHDLEIDPIHPNTPTRSSIFGPTKTTEVKIPTNILKQMDDTATMIDSAAQRIITNGKADKALAEKLKRSNSVSLNNKMVNATVANLKQYIKENNTYYRGALSSMKIADLNSIIQKCLDDKVSTATKLLKDLKEWKHRLADRTNKLAAKAINKTFSAIKSHLKLRNNIVEVTEPIEWENRTGKSFFDLASLIEREAIALFEELKPHEGSVVVKYGGNPWSTYDFRLAYLKDVTINKLEHTGRYRVHTSVCVINWERGWHKYGLDDEGIDIEWNNYGLGSWRIATLPEFISRAGANSA